MCVCVCVCVRVHACVHACVCVCVTERERKNRGGRGGWGEEEGAKGQAEHGTWKTRRKRFRLFCIQDSMIINLL